MTGGAGFLPSTVSSTTRTLANEIIPNYSVLILYPRITSVA